MVRRTIAILLISMHGTSVFAGPLHDAAQDGDLEKVRAIVDSGADLNTQNDVGETPLTISILEGHNAISALFIEKGADIHARNRGGFTPLHAAAYIDDKNVAEQLLNQGAEANDQENKAKASPLLIASEEGNVGVARILINHGATIEAAEQNGYTPLTRALWRGNQEVIALLQQSGAKCQPVEILEEPVYSECIAGQQ